MSVFIPVTSFLSIRPKVWRISVIKFLIHVFILNAIDLFKTLFEVYFPNSVTNFSSAAFVDMPFSLNNSIASLISLLDLEVPKDLRISTTW